MKTSVIHLLAVLLAMLAPVNAQTNPAPNIIFILTDDLGINDLGCYGRAEHHTPNLDRLAAAGTRFTTAYCAQPICSPSRAAILTGKHPARLRLTTFLPGRPDAPSQKLLHPVINQQLPLAERTIAEHLQDAGYATACIGKWHLGGKGFGPLEQGFGFYHPGNAVTQPSETEGGKGEYDLTRQAISFMETNRERPFFLYLAHNSPHIPFAARQSTVARNPKAFDPVYAAVIETLDDTVGLLLARLEALNLSSKTLVIFTSDNGGLHVPEGGHERITHNTPFRAGKGFLQEGGLRIPLIVRWPGHVPAGRVVSAPVSNLDWLPTLLDLANGAVPAGLDGETLSRLLLGGDPAPRRSFFWHFPHYTNQGSQPEGAVREGDWKLIEYYEEGRVELYNLARDLGETNDLSAKEPSRVNALRGALAAWRQQVSAQTNAFNPGFQPELHRALYEDVDASRFDPPNADSRRWEQIRQWRKQMNAVRRP